MNNVISLDELNLEYEMPQGWTPNTSATESYIVQLKKINKLPFNKGDFYYSDKVWDFSQYTSLNISKRKLKFNFGLTPSSFQDDVKNYVLIKILANNSKVQSIHRYVSTLNKFFKTMEGNGYYHIEDISIVAIRTFLSQQENVSINELRQCKTVLKDFYTLYSINFKDLMTTELSTLLELGDYRAFKAIKEQNKTPDIPQEYFNKFLSSIITIIDDDKAPLTIRTTACVYLIMSQTGLRISEALSLEINKLDTIKLSTGEEANYLTCKVWKPQKGNNTYLTVKIYINELAKKGYTTLLTLHKDKRTELDLPYLYMGGPNIKKLSQFPVSTDAFSRLQKKFYVYLNSFFPTINVPDTTYPELTRSKVNNLSEYPDAKTLTYPSNHQFRVHACTELYKQGIPLKYIQKFMAHLSSDMEGYYVRPTKKSPQEDMNFSLTTLEKIVTGEIKPLGGDSGLSAKIQEFIEANNYNVKTDLKEICNELAQKIPIRQKTGGVCIKSSMLRECSKDAKTNEFYCAYGVCPNIFHFYYMADVSYRQTKELAETITINQERGLLKQVQKELNMLNTILHSKLLPELDELKAVISEKGTLAILKEYPDLKDIIENLEQIDEEVITWKSMIASKKK